MTTFVIDTDDNITAYAPAEAPEAGLHFDSEKEFAKVTLEWPAAHFVTLWNSFAGVAPFGALKATTKFTDRATAIARIWKAIQVLADGINDNGLDAVTFSATKAKFAETKATPQVAAAKAPKAVRKAPAVKQPKAAATPAKAAKPAKVAATPSQPRGGSKQAQVIGMLRKLDGATLKEIMRVTEWQAHTVRGFMSGALKKKLGLSPESFKNADGERAYRLPKGAGAA